MISFVFLSNKKIGELNNFLSSFYNTNLEISNKMEWKKEFQNPVESTDLISAYIDNWDKFLIKMWLCLDNKFYINITPKNGNEIIKYIFERYPL